MRGSDSPGNKQTTVRRAPVKHLFLAAGLLLPMGGHEADVPRRVLVIGHRGNPTEAPENTLSSIRSAFAVGADLVEVDVQLSRDNIPVIIHDPTVDRTTDGRGPVAAKTLAELKNLDAGSWKDVRFTGERIPTLAEALRAAAGRGRLVLDLKVDGLAAAIASVLREEGIPVAAVVIATWTPQQRAEVRQHLEGAAIAQAMEVPRDWTPADMARWRAEGIVIFDVPNPNPDFVRAAHAHAMSVWAFTINDVLRMRQVMATGVDGFETDVPRLGAAYAGSTRVTR